MAMPTHTDMCSVRSFTDYRALVRVAVFSKIIFSRSTVTSKYLRVGIREKFRNNMAYEN